MPPDTISHALALLDAGRLPDAQAVCHRILRQTPNHPAAIHVLGLIAQDTGHNDLALDLFRQSIALQPSVPDYHNNLGNALADLHRPAEAAQAYRTAITLRPDYPEAHANLAHVLAELDHLPQAAAAYRQAIQLNPAFAPAYADLANLLRRMNRIEEAAQTLQSAPRTPETLHARFLLHQHQHQWPEAQAALESAIALQPDHAQSHLSLALHLLLLGQFEQGWREYEWRWHTPDRRGDLRQFPQPLWDGTQRQGKQLLLHCEQGLGTTFQFVRYAPLLADQGYQVILECQSPLKRILTCLAPKVTVLARGEPLPPFDAHASLLSIPRIVGTTLTTIPANIPYLQADPHLVARWRQELSRYPGPKIGIAWQGNPHWPDDKQRSIPLKHFAPLAALPNVTLLSLQKGPGTDQIQAVADKVPLVDLSPQLDTENGAFMDTAAVMMSSDLVITSDTSIAHLAGALGVPVWVALCHVPDWRWLLEREDCPWYPTTRLFRQKMPAGDWQEVFHRIAAAAVPSPNGAGFRGSF